MKITAVFPRKLSLLKMIIAIICLISLFGNILSECNIKFGCLARQKFMSLVTVQDKSGQAIPLRTIFNYKVVYIFTDRLVFYSSPESGSPTLEPEEATDEIAKIEGKMERVIHFGEIILDCGKYHNKLCHAQEYPGIDKNASFKIVQKKIVNNADVYCLVLPFFENGYKQAHEKMAFICATDAKDLYNIITFKNYISRKIELYQLRVSNDRYNGFNGILKRRAKYVTAIDGKKVPVIAKIFNTGIQLNQNDETQKYIKLYSFYQQRLFKNGAYVVSHGLAKKRVPPLWSKGFNPEPSPDCCIYFKGESENITICIASPDGLSVETASDICQIKMKGFYSDVMNSLRGIKFAEAYHELSHNDKKLKNCKSEEFKILKWRAEKTIDYAINVDCRYVMNYVSSDEYKQKETFCNKNYTDELKLELKLMSLDNEKIYDAINNCVYKSPSFSKVFQVSHFKKLMDNAKLSQKGTSFMELESNVKGKETDEIDDDDENVSTSHRESEPTQHENHDDEQNLSTFDNVDDSDNIDEHHSSSDASNTHYSGTLSDNSDDSHDEVSFTEVKSNLKSMTPPKGKGGKKKGIKDLVYSKPKDGLLPADVTRMKIFRNSKMKEMQKSHTWSTSPREAIDEKFNKNASNYGKKNTDEFVTFLGFLRDASYRASKVIAKSEEKKLMQNSK